MRLPKIAKIAVEQAAFHFDKFYDYYLPEALEPVEPGCRVLVPFGGGNRKRQGLIVGFSESAEVERLKPIAAVLDKGAAAQSGYAGAGFMDTRPNLLLSV